nr:hypothetical protein CFP56_28462 [Quercus suber]
MEKSASNSWPLSDNVNQFQHRLQQRIRYFFEAITTYPIWDEAVEGGILTIPPAEEWQDAPFLAHIVPVMTRQRYVKQLAEHLQRKWLHVHAIEYPEVPKGRSRVRIVIHAANNEADIGKLASNVLILGTYIILIMPKLKRDILELSAPQQQYTAKVGSRPTTSVAMPGGVRRRTFE